MRRASPLFSLSGNRPEGSLKQAWMDSMDFDHELGQNSTNEVHATEAICRFKHPCIAKSEESPDPTGHNCHPLRVYVVDADKYDAELHIKI